MAQPVVVVPSAPGHTRTMSYDAFLAWAGDDVRAEWVAGQVIVFVPTTIRHAELTGFRYGLLSTSVRLRNLGRVSVEQVEMRLRPGGPSRRPEVLFVGRGHVDRLTRLRTAGPAAPVVEVVSDDSVTRDRVDNIAKYQSIGVPEYPICDPGPGHERTDFFRLNAPGAYEPVAPDADGRYHSTGLPGFQFRPEWLRRTPPPAPLECLAQIAPAAMAAALGDPAGSVSDPDEG